MSVDNAKKFLTDYFEKTDPILINYMGENTKTTAELGLIPQEVSEYFTTLTRKGKKFRGGLVVLSYMAAGGKNLDEIYDMSISMEMFHAGLLVQDDVMDNDDMRRGLTSMHKQFEKRAKDIHVAGDPLHFGETIAYLAGDMSFFLAWDKILGSDFPIEFRLKAANIYIKYALRVMNGQVLDVTITGAEELNEKDILNVIFIKSGEYTCVLPMMMGAVLAGLEDKGKLDAIQNYASNLGWAFHIQDDILGMFGDSDETGKPNISDLREGKNTLLMLHLKKHGSPKQLEILEKALGNPLVTEEQADEIREILKTTGSYQHVIDLGWDYVAKGKKFIPQITDDKQYADIMDGMIEYMMARTK